MPRMYRLELRCRNPQREGSKSFTRTEDITFYQFGNSVCCQKARITMSEKGLNWEPIEINLFRNEAVPAEYLKINPKGVMPAIIHDGKAIIESTLIPNNLDDVYPTPLLIPQDPYLRTQMRLWSKMVDEGLHEASARSVSRPCSGVSEEFDAGRARGTLPQYRRSAASRSL